MKRERTKLSKDNSLPNKKTAENMQNFGASNIIVVMKYSEYFSGGNFDVRHDS
jgi:hypothetical protein